MLFNKEIVFKHLMTRYLFKLPQHTKIFIALITGNVIAIFLYFVLIIPNT